MSDLGPNFSTRPVLRVDLKALKANYKALQSMVSAGTHVAAAVKADAYGLGADRVGKALYGAGCRTFFVATAGEGKLLRQAIGENATIYVLTGPAPRDLTLFFGAQLKPVINSIVQARIWAEAASKARHAPYSALHIDTGMNRLGMTEGDIEHLSKNRSLRDELQIDLIMSHLACASDPKHPANKEQLSAFRRAAGRFPIKAMSLANTAGIYLGKPYNFNMVRPGIGLYGGAATNNPKMEKMQPVASLLAPVLQLRTLKAGESIGYNSTFTAKREMTVAGAGYADGIPVAASSQGESCIGHATLQKKRCPIVGRVSMDLTTIDVTDVKKKPRIGDWVELLGENLEDDAKASSTLNYEMLVRMGSRARREYR